MTSDHSVVGAITELANVFYFESYSDREIVKSATEEQSKAAARRKFGDVLFVFDRDQFNVIKTTRLLVVQIAQGRW